MPRPGVPQRGRDAEYDPSSGKPWKTSFILQPAEAEKVLRAKRHCGLTVSGMLNELIKRMEVDEDGRPVWAAAESDEEVLFDNDSSAA